MRKPNMWNYVVDGDRWKSKDKRCYYLFFMEHQPAARDVWVELRLVKRKTAEVVLSGWQNQVAPKFKVMVQAGQLKPIRRKVSERHGPGMELWW